MLLQIQSVKHRRRPVDPLRSKIGPCLPSAICAPTPEQAGGPRTEKYEAAIALISKDAGFAKDGVFTVALTATDAPFGIYASDTRTVIGPEPDIPRLVADSLGPKLKVVPAARLGWPPGLTSGKHDAGIANVTVTEQRKEKFDVSTYWKGSTRFLRRAGQLDRV